jgi:hypothetical protein
VSKDGNHLFFSDAADKPIYSTSFRSRNEQQTKAIFDLGEISKEFGSPIQLLQKLTGSEGIFVHDGGKESQAEKLVGKRY